MASFVSESLVFRSSGRVVDVWVRGGAFAEGLCDVRVMSASILVLRVERRSVF